jgi:hypothetical protein
MEAMPSAEQLGATARALRFALAVLDESDRQEAGGNPADASGVTMSIDEARELAPMLAMLLVATTRELARVELYTEDPAEQNRAARERLQRQLEAHEVNATFAAVEAEMHGDGG